MPQNLLFDQCFVNLMKEEGVEVAPNGEVIDSGYSNNPNDKGGETKFGVTAKTYGQSVKNLTLQQAHEFYKSEFWISINCDSVANISAPVAAIYFDAAVNQGQDWAKRALQRVVGVTEDGIIGPYTIEALKKDVGVSLVRVIHSYGDERLAKYAHIAIIDHSQEGWLAGWILRVISVKRFAFSLNV